MLKPIMNLSIQQKLKEIIRSIYVQLVFVVLSFAVMVFTSYLYVSKIERGHLKKETENAIAITQANILSALLEPEVILSDVTKTVRIMMLDGAPFDIVANYISRITGSMLNSEQPTYVTGIYGVFDAFGGKFHSGTGWAPPEDIVPENRPWYEAAVKANGKVGITEPLIDREAGVVSMTYAQRIFDDDGRPLGIICLDILIEKIRKYAVNTSVTEDSYGILFDNHFRVIAHPQSSFLGREMRTMNDGAAVEDMVRKGVDISEFKAKDYNGDTSILFVRQLQNGWHIAVIAYAKQYYQNMARVAALLSVIGFLLSVILNAVLIRMTAEKNKSDTESRQKSNFLAMISHEIRTPMNAILGITEIQMHNKTLPPDTKEALTKIYHSGYSLLGIINDVLDLSKIEAGKLELLPDKYDVASLINDTTQLNIMRIGSKPIKFELKVDPFTPSELFGDELRIKQILNNLLSNAFKYTESGEVVLSVTVKYEDRVRNPHVSLIFYVLDTGQGMTKEQVGRLFDEYSRFNQDVNRMTEGTGLGMSITKHLVNMMNGVITVESEIGKGSLFSVYLPQKNIGAAPLGKEVAENLKQFRFHSLSQMKTEQIVYDPMPYGHVLVVDDVETNLYVAKGLMAPYSLTVDTASSGTEAIERIKAGSVYDIVFMDHMMPVMDGIEATKIIRSLGYTQPIVALTANAMTGQAEMFMSNGFDYFISKPVGVCQLNTVLNKMIRDKQPPEVLEAAKKNSAGKQPVGTASQSSIDHELARTFMRDAGKAVSVLEAMCAKRDILDNDDDVQMFTIKTHAMKSALANIGEKKLSDDAYELETAGRNRDAAVISAGTPVFLESLRAVMQKFSQEEAESSPGDEKPDMAFLQEKLLIFRAACVVYDKKAAKDVMVELKKRKWPHSIKDFLNVLTEHLLHSEFEEAERIAKDFEVNSGGQNSDSQNSGS